MIAPPIHECPECSGAFDVQNVSKERHEKNWYTDWYFLCEFSKRRWEISVCDSGDRFTLEYREKTEPRNFGAFVGRLKAARAA